MREPLIYLLLLFITSVRNNRFTDWRVARRGQTCGKAIPQIGEFYCLPLILTGYKPHQRLTPSLALRAQSRYQVLQELAARVGGSPRGLLPAPIYHSSCHNHSSHGKSWIQRVIIKLSRFNFKIVTSEEFFGPHFSPGELLRSQALRRKDCGPGPQPGPSRPHLGQAPLALWLPASCTHHLSSSRPLCKALLKCLFLNHEVKICV